jgi:hypothetical protein
MLVDELSLEGVEEALGDGVVEAAPGPAGAEEEAAALGELLDSE